MCFSLKLLNLTGYQLKSKLSRKGEGVTISNENEVQDLMTYNASWNNISKFNFSNNCLLQKNILEANAQIKCEM